MNKRVFLLLIEGSLSVDLYEWCTYNHRLSYWADSKVIYVFLKQIFLNIIPFISSVLGHEAVVEVVAHRRPESDLAVGDRLTFSVADSCGKCEFCTTGLNQKCVKLFKV